MLRSELVKRSPIRVLEKSIHDGLGKGNLGVFTARKGVGKTACLVHVAIDQLMDNHKVLHISFSEDPQHIERWYRQVFREVTSAYKLDNPIENFDQMIHNRLILQFKQDEVTMQHVQESIERFTTQSNFEPQIIIVDGFSFYTATAADFEIWQDIAVSLQVEMWFTATLHRENLKFDSLGVPAPVNEFYDLFAVIIMLNPKRSYIDLSLLKDHDNNNLEKLRLKLDSKTLLISNHRV